MCLCGSQNKQRLFSYTALTDWFLQPRRRVFTARYGPSVYKIHDSLLELNTSTFRRICHGVVTVSNHNLSTRVTSASCSDHFTTGTTAKDSVWTAQPPRIVYEDEIPCPVGDRKLFQPRTQSLYLLRYRGFQK